MQEELKQLRLRADTVVIGLLLRLIVQISVKHDVGSRDDVCHVAVMRFSASRGDELTVFSSHHSLDTWHVFE